MAGTKYWVWLSECRGLPLSMRLRLLEHFGSPENVFYAETDDYLHVEGMTPRLAAQLADKSTAEADRILGECDRLGARILTMQDADYPTRLRNIYEPPCLLYVKGKLPIFDEEAAIAVVGTRKATPYGVETAEELCYAMARQGALIVSGGAYGIDSAAHRGALRAGAKTVALLGCGVDVVYPAGNEQLYRDIIASGALMTEYPPGTPARGGNFPVRNRIISGLCLATVVVEAPDTRSGALITAQTALEQGRDVFAVPGPIKAPMSRGCNRLIADGAAALVADTSDILWEYEARYPHKLHCGRVEMPNAVVSRAEKPAAEPKAAPEPEPLPKLDVRAGTTHLTDDQIRIVKRLREGEMQVDDLIEAVELPTRRVLSALTVLEIEGYVAQGGGRRFSLCAELIEE